MTNGILDTALVEMLHHSALRLTLGYVLLTGQSATFKACHNKRVTEDDALTKIQEVYEVIPPARYECFLMMLNLVGQHWISVVVQSQGTIHSFDSSDGSCKEEKNFAVARVKLFAREIGRLRRLGNLRAPMVDKCEVKFVNVPAQGDGYNCGQFALDHLWCAANGMDLARMNDVVGDPLRLGIFYTLEVCGKRYEDARLAALAST